MVLVIIVVVVAVTSSSGSSSTELCVSSDNERLNVVVLTGTAVVQVSVVDYQYINNTTRYDVRVDDLLRHDDVSTSLGEREFIWVDNICRCPRLLIGESYVVMGRLTAAAGETRETHLELTQRSVAMQLGTWQQRFASRNFRCRRFHR